MRDILLARRDRSHLWLLCLLLPISPISTAGCGDAPDTSAFPTAFDSSGGTDGWIIYDVGEGTDTSVEDVPELTDTTPPVDVNDNGDADTALADIEDTQPSDVADDADDADSAEVAADTDIFADCDPPCENGGICDLQDGTCDCPPEYMGPLCETRAPDCGAGCQNRGVCIGANLCECPAGWIGPLCEYSACQTGCANAGVCVGIDQCDCTTGWMGLLCADEAPSFVGLVSSRLGVFTAGSPTNEVGRIAFYEGAVSTEVTVAFGIMATELTQGQWKVLFNGVLPDGQSKLGDDLPVGNMTWWSALEAANALSIAQGLDYCYALPSTVTCPGAPESFGAGTVTCPDQTNVVIRSPDKDVLKCEGYRLPTEAEWELAARAGSTKALYDPEGGLGGSLENNGLTCNIGSQPALESLAWWCGSTQKTLQSVGTKPPNFYGLYDVLGNVAEWTWDNFDPAVPSGVDPRRDKSRTWQDITGATQGAARTARGGSLESATRELRLAARRPVTLNLRSPDIGLRLVRTLRP